MQFQTVTNVSSLKHLMQEAQHLMQEAQVHWTYSNRLLPIFANRLDDFKRIRRFKIRYEGRVIWRILNAREYVSGLKSSNKMFLIDSITIFKQLKQVWLSTFKHHAISCNFRYAFLTVIQLTMFIELLQRNLICTEQQLELKKQIQCS